VIGGAAAPRDPGGVRVSIRVRPGAKKESVGGRWDGPRGVALLVAVRARAVEGQANAAVVGALAEAFDLAPSRVSLVAGERGRDKIVDLDGPEDAVAARLAQLLDLQA
jgi:uncharacterized protein (TIGR00251 family)